MLAQRTILNNTLHGITIWHFWKATALALLRGGWSPGAFVNGGIAALLLTPYLRVLASLLYFALIERNLKFVFFTGVVLAVLTHSLFLR
jgi:uncharacterized membrane protein